jgi:hypothetical protein
VKQVMVGLETCRSIRYLEKGSLKYDKEANLSIEDNDAYMKMITVFTKKFQSKI